VRLLVQVEPNKLELVKSELRRLGIWVVKQVPPNYISIEAPIEMKEKIEEIPGVVRVYVEEVYRIAIPVEMKLREFLRLGGPTNPLALIWAAGFRKVRWATSDSRKVLGADIADKLGITGKGVKVAVLDTGFDLLLNPQKPMVDYVYSTIEGQPAGHDENGHGVHVLTTIAGSKYLTPWGWLEGIAKGVSVAAIKCLGYGIGTATTSDVMEAIVAAYNWGAKVINMSLGSDIGPEETHDPNSCPLCSLVKMLSDRGIIFVVAAGNSGVGHASCPGASLGAITVGALKKDLTVADFSSRKHSVYLEYRKPDVSAPGVDIGSTTCGLIDIMEWVDGPKVAFISGTSMATPHITGLVALWVEYAEKKGYRLTKDVIMDMISKYSSWDPEVGYGVPRFEWIVDYLR
jgi:Subtilisin-like serine proteases